MSRPNGYGRRQFLAAAGAASLAGVGARVGSGANGATERPIGDRLTEVASVETPEVTGVAVAGGEGSDDERIFVNFPRFPWAVAPNEGPCPADVTDVNVSVAELRDGELVPYPNAAWNRDGWRQDHDEWVDELAPSEHFVCVQSVHVNPNLPNTLWALDPGNPGQTGVVENAPKLVEIDLRTDSVEEVYAFDGEGVDGQPLVPRRKNGAYLNDARIDAEGGYAFVTDSALGALVAYDLDAGEGRRLFDDESEYPSTHAGGPIEVGPHECQDEPLTVRGIHSDGIAFDRSAGEVYYHALAGRRLYRIPTSALTAFCRPEPEVADCIEDLGETDATDGMIADEAGNVYHTALAKDAVTRWTAETGEMETIAQSDRLRWPDTFSFSPSGDLYVTTSKIHLERTGTRRESFELFRIDAEELRGEN